MRFVVAGLTALALLVPVQAGAVSAALSIEANQAYLRTNAAKPGWRVTRDGLQYKVVKPGFGKTPKDGDDVTCYYSLKMINSDQVLEGSEPDFPTKMPLNKLVAGWREALKIMKEGDRWQIVLPASLAYGPAGSSNGMIPPNQTLIFDLELVKTETPPKKPGKDDQDQDQGQ